MDLKSNFEKISKIKITNSGDSAALAKVCRFGIWTSIREAVNSKQTLPFFHIHWYFLPDLIYETSVFSNTTNKWYTADFKLRGLCRKRVFLVPPSYKTKQDASAKRKGKCESSVFVDCFWQKRKKKKIEEHILWKFLSELDETKRLNFQVIVAWSSCTGQASVSNHTYCTTHFSALHLYCSCIF